MPKKGFSRAVYAVMTSEALETYGMVKEIPLGVKLNVVPKTADGKFYAYDVLAVQDMEFSEADVTLELGDLTKQLEIDWLGYEVDANGAILSRGNAQAPYVAIGYEVPMTGGKIGYMWLTKGKFGIPTEDAQTKGEGFTYGTSSIVGKFAARLTDGIWKTRAITGDACVPIWFNAPYLGVPAIDATYKAVLEASIVQAKSLVQSSYTAGTWSAMVIKRDDAIAVYDNGTATQVQINTATKGLTDAIAALVAA